MLNCKVSFLILLLILVLTLMRIGIIFIEEQASLVLLMHVVIHHSIIFISTHRLSEVAVITLPREELVKVLVLVIKAHAKIWWFVRILGKTTILAHHL